MTKAISLPDVVFSIGMEDFALFYNLLNDASEYGEVDAGELGVAILRLDEIIKERDEVAAKAVEQWKTTSIYKKLHPRNSA